MSTVMVRAAAWGVCGALTDYGAHCRTLRGCQVVDPCRAQSGGLVIPVRHPWVSYKARAKKSWFANNLKTGQQAGRTAWQQHTQSTKVPHPHDCHAVQHHASTQVDGLQLSSPCRLRLSSLQVSARLVQQRGNTQDKDRAYRRATDHKQYTHSVQRSAKHPKQHPDAVQAPASELMI